MLKNGYSRVLFRNADSDMVFSDARRGTLGLEKLALVFICGFQEIVLRLLPTVSGTCCGRSCTARRPRRRVGPLCHAGAGHLQAKQTTTGRPYIHSSSYTMIRCTCTCLSLSTPLRPSPSLWRPLSRTFGCSFLPTGYLWIAVHAWMAFVRWSVRIPVTCKFPRSDRSVGTVLLRDHFYIIFGIILA